jgi:hypothetical protein
MSISAAERAQRLEARLARLRAEQRARESSNVKNAFQLAKQHLGKDISEVKIGGDAVGRAMHDGIENNINCANFVSGVLEAAGQIPASLHNNENDSLVNGLAQSGRFKEVSLEDAKPGDVVNLATGRGHVVLFAGWEGGKVGGTPLFIGSNNVNADGSQRVTIGEQSASITSILRYVGPGGTPFTPSGATESAGGSGAGSGGVATSSDVSGSTSPVSHARQVNGSSRPDSSNGGADAFASLLLTDNWEFEFLLDILKQYGITKEDLYKANPGLKKKVAKNDGKIPKGTELNLPKDVGAVKAEKIQTAVANADTMEPPQGNQPVALSNDSSLDAASAEGSTMPALTGAEFASLSLTKAI